MNVRGLSQVSTPHSHRRLTVAVVAMLARVVSGPALALDQMVPAVHATPAELAAAGLGNLDGTGQKVANIEAGSGIPNVANIFFAAGGIALIAQGILPADNVTNHATEVTGVIASQAPQPGIAPATGIIAAGATEDPPGMLGFRADAIFNSQGAIVGGAKIVNYSWGIGLHGPPPAPVNDGTDLVSEFVDWAATTTPGATIQDVLFIVAGNEGAPNSATDNGSRSDAYNCINVAATGRRNAAGNVIYDREANYNQPNDTADGRFKTDIVAPGGDSGPSAGLIGTWAAPPAADNHFVSTGGGVLDYIGTLAAGAAFLGVNCPLAAGAAGCDVFDIDDFNLGGLTDDAMLVVDNTAAFGAINAADAVVQSTIAGTSFAAPLVAGAGSLLRQFGAANGHSTDHRVLKAIILNGASKRSPDGTADLTDQMGNAWARVGATTSKYDPIGGGFIQAIVGLDPFLGTGQLDVTASGLNYDAGQQGPGAVMPVGWDLDVVATLTINSYTFATIGGKLSATLAWDHQVSLVEGSVVGNAGNGVWDSEDANANAVLDVGEDLSVPANGGAPDEESFAAAPLNDLDIELFVLVGGVFVQVEVSTSLLDNVEHIFVDLPAGTYRLDVVNRSPVAEHYAVAWRMFGPPPPLVDIASANPPTDNLFLAGQRPFRDVLQTGPTPALTQGIGAAGTPAQNLITYSTISVTFSGTPGPAPTAGNVGVSCAGSGPYPCPTVTSVIGSGAGPYQMSLSGAIPPRNCTTLTFAGTNVGQKLQYQYLPGDINYSGSVSASDISVLVIAINNGQASLPSNLPHFNVNRAGAVSTVDLLRLLGLLNGVNTTQPWTGATVAACP